MSPTSQTFFHNPDFNHVVSDLNIKAERGQRKGPMSVRSELQASNEEEQEASLVGKVHVSYMDLKYQALELFADNNGGIIGHGMKPCKD